MNHHTIVHIRLQQTVTVIEECIAMCRRNKPPAADTRNETDIVLVNIYDRGHLCETQSFRVSAGLYRLNLIVGTIRRLIRIMRHLLQQV
ncbi:hypothetical protein D3C86_1282950 [compost metagenome]